MWTILITVVVTVLAVVLAMNFATPEKKLERRILHRYAVADPQFRGAMEKVQTPITYLDAPEFAGFLAKDAARLKVAVEKIGPIDAKK